MKLKMKAVKQMRFLQVLIMMDQVKQVHNYDSKTHMILRCNKNNRLNRINRNQ